MSKFGISLAIHAMFLWFSPLQLSGRAPALACSHGALYLFRGKKKNGSGALISRCRCRNPMIIIRKSKDTGENIPHLDYCTVLQSLTFSQYFQQNSP